MSEPESPQKAPYEVEVVEGKKYLWCACGRSNKQPFCDGSHAGTDFKPVVHEAKAGGKEFFCGCKHTGTPPLCDGTHETL